MLYRLDSQCIVDCNFQISKFPFLSNQFHFSISAPQVIFRWYFWPPKNLLLTVQEQKWTSRWLKERILMENTFVIINLHENRNSFKSEGCDTYRGVSGLREIVVTFTNIILFKYIIIRWWSQMSLWNIFFYRIWGLF